MRDARIGAQRATGSLLRALIAAALLTVPAPTLVGIAPAAAAGEGPPQVSTIDRGVPIDDVSIEAYGNADTAVAMRYLSLRAGSVLEQRAVERDYTNLATLAGLRTRLEIRRHPASASVSLRWIVLGKWFQLTDHPFYGDQPLSIPIEGFGWVFTSHPLDTHGATLSSYSQVALRAQLARIVYTKPLWV
ncbi:MAG: hypothetical protein IAI49_03800, partial [Candidatus Eremiobacteraeota bacterium]|nr:hypothetical protein [Candidatus Eremiobacteraeota bacterium]